ncbi:putative DNA modification/repair radical SAM protein [Massilia oculi]|uniref:Biotin synthase n=3 Tax=Massilia TaxID=149698 RepID=A0A422QIJ3_9BURK|nr:MULTISPECIES: putative DNA modification/repair radical SAM protein [Massilia]AWL05724.1 putative DNA modification/repair radical SAM protein [Massilia oculi]MDY0961781.1 putative DNA modification/repair radical SAM protein [Massilia sp. CFBP9026]RNF29784.1 biotin synthase [Massilia aurea]TXF98715.1 putative DNA modification/repair radical SAM protein [Massilia arenae]
MELNDKLEILADAAKYDASCASSGAPKRGSEGKDGLGATTGMGICHSYTPDGRCVSLLKILLTNFCIYDCQYCINRRTSNVPRARFAVDEVVKLTQDFYLRNYIDGLFLSSGIIQSADYTMEQLVAVARQLREVHQFRGYIHLKTIPDADPLLIQEAGRWADRLSVNIELPTHDSVTRLAPEKSVHTIKLAMGSIRRKLDEKAEEPKAPAFAPAGQSTQMIVGADASDDHTILNTAETLYGSYKLKRVYYSAFSPIPQSPGSVPLAPPPLLREHRLYQADFLLRGYGFTAGELMPQTGNLALDVDPKLAWALSNREHFPMDLNRVDASLIPRIPGIGLRNAKRIVELRRLRRIRWEDLSRLRCSLKKLAPFVVTADYKPAQGATSSDLLRKHMADAPQQMNLWPELQAA